jgi:hypothetical protein
MNKVNIIGLDDVKARLIRELMDGYLRNVKKR